ncbi:hypothetical protein ACQ4PT_042150 [Festuca glaucescens]
MTPVRSGESPQAAEMPECIRGRRWADVAEEADAEEAAREDAVARCSPPRVATLGDYLAVAHRGRPRRSPPQVRRSVGRGRRQPPLSRGGAAGSAAVAAAYAHGFEGDDAQRLPSPEWAVDARAVWAGAGLEAPERPRGWACRARPAPQRATLAMDPTWSQGLNPSFHRASRPGPPPCRIRALHPPPPAAAAAHRVLRRHGAQAATRTLPQPLAAGATSPVDACLLPASPTAGALPSPGPPLPSSPRRLPAPALPSPELASPPFPRRPARDELARGSDTDRNRTRGRDHAPPSRGDGLAPHDACRRSPARRASSPGGARREAALREELTSRAQFTSRGRYEAPWRAERGRSPPRDRRSPLRREEQLPHAAAPTGTKKKKKPKKKRAGAGGAAGGAVGGSQVGHPPMAPPQGRGFDGRADTQLVVSAPPEKSPTSNICFNCGEMGHFRSDCTLPEQRRREVIEFLGHGIDGGFYYIDLRGAELSTPQHLAVITVLPEQDPPLQIEVTVDTIRAELTQLESTCAWNVREISPTEFAVAFPSAELLRALSWSKTTILPANNISVSVRPSCVDPDTVATLSEVWVRVHGIPEEARSEHIIELISQAIGKLVTVDLLTLPGTGPVRMLILSPDPAKLTCTLPQFFFGKGGRALVVEVEGDETQAGSPTPPLDPSQPHREDDDAEDDDDSSDGDSEDDLGGDGEETPQGQALGGGAGDAAPGAQSALPGTAQTHRSAPARMGTTISRAPPADTVESCGLSIMEYGSNFPQKTSSASVGLDVCPPQSPRSPGVVCYTRSPGSTPTSPLGPATPGPAVLEPAPVFPDTPVAGAKARAPRRQRQSTQPSRHSVRLARGFEAPGRQQQLKEYMRRENVDIVGLLETIKESFLLHELEGLSRHKFAWHWRSASGHSGGILLGVNEDTFEVEDMDHGEFFVSMAVTHKRSNLSWEVIIVYGPTDHSRSQSFLEELRNKINRSTTPVVVAGDFNLIRSPEDKSSSLVDIPRMQMFNDCLADLALREITRVGARFTWSNNRIDPVQSVLDRVFVSVEWEMEFPLCSLRAATRIGSDHSPLLLCSGGSAPPRINRFHFENFWLRQPGFAEAVGCKWERAADSPPRVFNAVDVWHHCAKIARQFMRGWGANLGAEVR